VSDVTQEETISESCRQRYSTKDEAPFVVRRKAADHPQVPMLQVSPGAQALKHVPQCSGSVGKTAQWVPHLLMLGLGKHWQTPAVQVPTPVHGVSQAPQWLLSSCRSAHWVLHSSRAPAHSHTPAWQLEPGGHTFPQLPQLF
jgi:hypothetical protein